MTDKALALHISIAFLIILSLLVFDPFPTTHAGPIQTPSVKQATATSTVVEVVDGDTVKLANGEKVRYLILDTPETKHPSKPVEYFGVKASKFNEKLVEGEKVKLEFDVRRRDDYGRLLAYVYVRENDDWICVNAELLREGYARLSTIPPNVKYVDYFLKLERRARENCQGLWNAYCEKPPVFTAKEIEERLEEYEGGVVSVQFEVTSTYDAGNIIFINSSSDYETDFTAVILPDDLQYFHEREIHPVRDYEGKKIQVTGELQEYDGPEIILYHPYQVEIIDQEDQTSAAPRAENGGDSVEITCVHFDASGNDHTNENGEWVIFEANKEIDMGSWVLSDEADHKFIFPEEFTLSKGERVKIYTGSPDDKKVDTGCGQDVKKELYWGSGRAIWNNSGDIAYLRAEEKMIDTCRYSGSGEQTICDED